MNCGLVDTLWLQDELFDDVTAHAKLEWQIARYVNPRKRLENSKEIIWQPQGREGQTSS